MKKGNLTREQAICIVGTALVEKVDTESCDFTNRVGFNGSCQGDSEVEFSASVSGIDVDGYDIVLTAYYYQSADSVDECGDNLSNLDWVITGYEIV